VNSLKFDDNCIFCKIVQKQAPASIIYEDELVMAFLDIRPVNEGHALVVCKEHYEGIFDIPAELLGKVHEVSKKVAIAVKQAVNAEGIGIVQQNGRAANQDIFHLHVHVVPRFNGVALPRFSDLELAERSALDELAKKIKAAL